MTLFGIITVVNELQPLNALSPILVTLFGIVVFLQPTIKLFVDDLIIALQLFLES